MMSYISPGSRPVRALNTCMRRRFAPAARKPTSHGDLGRYVESDLLPMIYGPLYHGGRTARHAKMVEAVRAVVRDADLPIAASTLQQPR